jgi:hypothetical protein
MIGMNTVDWNDFSCYNTSTGLFRAPRAGRYLFCGNAVAECAANALVGLAIGKYDTAGTTLIERVFLQIDRNYAGSASVLAVSGTASLFLEVDEQVAFQYFLGNGAGVALYGNNFAPNSTGCLFMGHALT